MWLHIVLMLTSIVVVYFSSLGGQLERNYSTGQSNKTLEVNHLLITSGIGAWGEFLKIYCTYIGFCTLNVKKSYILYRMHNVISNILFVYNQ